jgi:hypothetical protein
MGGMATDIESPIDELGWPEFESVVAELAALSRADISPEVLATELLERVVDLLGAVGLVSCATRFAASGLSS